MRAAVALSLLLAAPAAAEVPSPRALQDLARAVERTLQAADTVAGAEARWMAMFAAADADGDGAVTTADRALQDRVATARLRAEFVAEKLRMDLDGDLALDAGDLLPFLRPLARRPEGHGDRATFPGPATVAAREARLLAAELAADVDGDGVVTLAELMAAPLPRGMTAAGRRGSRASMLAGAADADGDGQVSAEEFMAPLRFAAAAMDTNGDGALSRIEKRVAAGGARVPRTDRARKDRAMLEALMPPRGCDLSPRQAEAEIVLIGGYEGAAMSDLLVGRPPRVSHVIDVEIAPGERPIALRLAFPEVVILRLSGDVGRVRETLTLGAQFGLVGLGRQPLLRAGQIQGDCKLDLWRPLDEGRLREQLRLWTGREDTVVARGYTLGRVRLVEDGGRLAAQVEDRGPRGETPEFGPLAAAVWAEFLRYSPGGLVRLDPEGVYTVGAVKTQADPWPRQAGLAALVEDGALTPLADRAVQDIRRADGYGVVRFTGKTLRWSGGDDAVRDGDLVYTEEEPGRWFGRAPALYRINRAIALPPGLYGAHAAEFLLPPGVPEPAGDRAHTRLRPDPAP